MGKIYLVLTHLLYPSRVRTDHPSRTQILHPFPSYVDPAREGLFDGARQGEHTTASTFRMPYVRDVLALFTRYAQAILMLA